MKSLVVCAADDRARGQAGGGGQVAEIGEGHGARCLSERNNRHCLRRGVRPHQERRQHGRACHAEAQSHVAERRRTTLNLLRSCICFTCRNLFRDSRIGLQNAERQARLRAATGDFDVCSEREDLMRVPSGFGIGVLAVTLIGVADRIRKCPGRHRVDYRHRERSVGAVVLRRHRHDHARRSRADADRRDARGRHLHLHADPHRRVSDRRRASRIQERSVDAASPSAFRNRSALDFILQAGGISEEVVVTGALAAAADRIGDGWRDAEVRRSKPCRSTAATTPCSPA